MLPELGFLLAILFAWSAPARTASSALEAVLGVLATVLTAWGGCRLLAERALTALREDGPQAVLPRLVLLPLPALLSWLVALHVFGWNVFALELLPPSTWLLRYALMYAPLFLAYAGAWAARGRVEGALAALRRPEVPAPTAWEAVRAGLRRNGLALLPMFVLLGLVAGVESLAELGVPGAEAAAHVLGDVPLAGTGLGLLLLAVLGYVLPGVLARVLPSRAFPPGETHDRLTRLAAAQGLRYREMRIWLTGGRALNAFVVGLTARTRRIFISDALLRGLKPDEVDAVFCHEAAHARRHHLVWFLLLTGLVSLTSALSDDALTALGVGDLERSLLFLALIWFGVLGFVSRRFERECDVDGGRFAAALEPDLPPQELQGLPRPLPAGAWRMVKALKRLEMHVGDVYSHRHGLLSARAAYVAWNASEPEEAARFARSMRRMKTAFAALALLLLALAAQRVPADVRLGRALGDLRLGAEAYGEALEAAPASEASAAAWRRAHERLRRAAEGLAERTDVRAVPARARAWLGVGDTALRGLGDLPAAQSAFERALADAAQVQADPGLAQEVAFAARIDLARVRLRRGGTAEEAAALGRQARQALLQGGGEPGAYARARLRLLEAVIDARGRAPERGRAALADLRQGVRSEPEWAELRRDAAEELALLPPPGPEQAPR